MSFTIFVTYNFCHFALSYQIKKYNLFHILWSFYWKWSVHGKSWFEISKLIPINPGRSISFWGSDLNSSESIKWVIMGKDWLEFWLKLESGWKLFIVNLFHIKLRTSNTIIGQNWDLESPQVVQFDHFISY